VVAGVMTDKMLLLNNEATVHVLHSIEPGPNLYQRLNDLQRELQQPPKPAQVQSALPASEIVSDFGAGNGV
jgi:hypothetical protein